MIDNRFNKKLRSFLAGSLGAICIVSTCVSSVNAMEENNKIVKVNNQGLDILSFSKEDRDTLWSAAQKKESVINLERENLGKDYSFSLEEQIRESYYHDYSYEYCVITQTQPNSNGKLILLKTSTDNIYILPCPEEKTVEMAETYLNYIHYAVTLNNFEKECWENKDNIDDYLAKKTKTEEEPETVNSENDNTGTKTRSNFIYWVVNFFNSLPPMGKATVASSVIGLVGILIQKFF